MKEFAPWLGIVALAGTILIQWGQQAERVDNLREYTQLQIGESKQREAATAQAYKEIAEQLTRVRIELAEVRTLIETRPPTKKKNQ